MNQVQLKTIQIEDVQAGMFIHSIALQRGNLEVKSRGRITSDLTIKRLIEFGIESVVVDFSQHRPPNTANDTMVDYIDSDLLDDSNVDATISDPALDEHAAAPLNNEAFQKETLNSDYTAEKLDFSDLDMEMARAQKLVLQCKGTQKQYAMEIKKDAFTDISAAENLVAELESSLERNPNALLSLMALRNANEYLAEHAIRVSVLLCHFGQSIGYEQAACRELALLGYLYDIGMTQLNQQALTQASELEGEDLRALHAHPKMAADLLRDLGLSESLLLAIEHHHERLHGQGYPHGISGEEIHTHGRMLAIVDAYDAMTSDRAHQAAISPCKALKELIKPESGFDHKLATAFVRCIGIYPVGSLVKLSNNRIGMVVAQNHKQPSKPVVKVFYTLTGNHYLAPKDISLASLNNVINVSGAVLAKTYKIETAQLFAS